MEQLEIRQYEGFNVSFLAGNRKVKVNATQMAKVFGKRIDNYLANEDTKAFIETLKLPDFSGDLDIKDESDIIEKKGRNGTWMHRVLALHFAAWLDKKFEVWVYITVDKLLFGELPKLAVEKSDLDKLVEKQEKKIKETEDYAYLLELKRQQKAVNKNINSQQKNQLTFWQ